MNSLLIAGKYLDQPRLVGKFSKAVPPLLVAGGAAFTLNHVRNTPKGEKRKELIKSFSVLAATIGSALLATRGLGQFKIGKKVLFNGFQGLSEKIDLNELVKSNTKLVDEFLTNNKVTDETFNVLNKAKSKILKFSEIKKVFKELSDQKPGKDFLSKLIPDPENVSSKHIFGEIKRLSLMGLVPVLGGIFGGIVGDRLTEKNWKERIPNKIKEGSYQYLANIFLCNVGAGGALALLEKANITSKSARAAGMVGGILSVGVFGGSAIANMIGKKFIDPLLDRNHGNGHHKCVKKGHGCHNHERKLYSERKPEALDVGLHVDDIATVAVLSGLKWIEPALPILYSISGYRAGIGYRNGGDCLHGDPVSFQQAWISEDKANKAVTVQKTPSVFDSFQSFV